VSTGPRQIGTGSLLDRLLGEGPRSRTSGSRFAVPTGVQESVRRDLENLLNTRWRCLSWPPDLEELEHSLVNYGIPDFTGASFNDPSSQRELRRIIQNSIRKFEPRLKHARVSVPEREDKQDRTLRFRIEAELQAGDSSRAVAFETALDPSTSTFHVGRAAR